MLAIGTNPKSVACYDPSKAYDGYTLFGPRGSRDMWLINMHGQFVHRWRMPGLIGDASLLPNGNLLIGSRYTDSPVADIPACGGEWLELDWDGNLVWKYGDTYLNLHDCSRLENGNTLVNFLIPLPAEVTAQVKGGIPGSERQGVMWSDGIREINPAGEVVWEWLAHEHMDFEREILCPLCSRMIWTYVNSMFALPNGDILLSFRHINTIAIVDKKTGDFKWVWGPGNLGHQHCPTMVENGNILVFDNGLHCPSTDNVAASSSRVLEVNPETNEIEWEYKAETITSFYSPICSSAQRLPNGNTLICEATKGRIFEVTRDKEIVWEFVNPLYFDYQPTYLGWTNMVYRAYRYAADYGKLNERLMDPNEFKWVLQCKGDSQSDEDEAQLVADRLKHLGY